MSIHFIAEKLSNRECKVTESGTERHAATVRREGWTWKIHLVAGSRWYENGKLAVFDAFPTLDEALKALARWGGDTIELMPESI